MALGTEVQCFRRKLGDRKPVTMWISREQAAVFALVLTMAWAQPFCDLSKMETMGASALKGIMYPVLASDGSFGEGVDRLGYNFQSLTHNGEQYYIITIYYVEENTQTCQQNTTACRISDNFCQYTDGTGFYEVAHGDNYLVVYTHRGGNVYTLAIHAKNFQRPQEIEDLPQNIRDKIEAACGSDSVRSNFYSRQFTPGNFIPNC